MYMKKSIIEFITGAIEGWDDNAKLGEEIRGLEETLETLIDEGHDSTFAAILMLIYLCPEDDDLGRHIRSHYIAFKIFLGDAETYP